MKSVQKAGPIDTALWHAPQSSAAEQPRQANGRFRAISDDTLIGDVATLRRRAPELVAEFGDIPVGELRDLFGGLSVTKIGQLKAAERAVFLGIAEGTPAQNAAKAAVILAMVTGRRPTRGAPLAGEQPARAPRGFGPDSAQTALTKNLRRAIDKQVQAHLRANPGAWQHPWVAEGLKLSVEASDNADALRAASKQGSAAKRAAYAVVQGFEKKLEAWVARAPR